MNAMRNPNIWNDFCSRFHEICAECLPDHMAIVDRFVGADVFDGSPNILFYGAEGFPINLLLDYMFAKMYGTFTRLQCQINSEMEYFQTQWFLEFDFHHPNFMKQSTECIEVIKQMIQGPSVHGGRHIIVLKNVDGALAVAKQMFRVLLERYSKNALFICTTHSFSKLEPPLRSRFTLVRIPLPTKREIVSIVHALGHTLDELHVSRNIYKTLLILDIMQTQPHSDLATLCSFHYPPLAELKKTLTLETIRTMANKICQTNIPVRSIVLDLLSLIKDDASKMEFLLNANRIEHMLACTNGGRQVLYMETLLHSALFTDKSK